MFSRKAQSISPSPTLTIDAKAKQLKKEGVDVIGFGAGEPDFETPAHIKEAAVRAMKPAYRYTPVAGIPELLEAVSQKLQRTTALPMSRGTLWSPTAPNMHCAMLLPPCLTRVMKLLFPLPTGSAIEMVKINDGVPVVIQTKRKTTSAPPQKTSSGL